MTWLPLTLPAPHSLPRELTGRSLCGPLTLRPVTPLASKGWPGLLEVAVGLEQTELGQKPRCTLTWLFSEPQFPCLQSGK